MKKKLCNVLLVLILALCAGPWRTSAQDLLTVADSTATNSYVPIYGLYLDDYIRTQIIYPEDMLTDMVGSTISELTFYLSTLPSNPGNWTSVLNIRMGTVAETAFATTSPAFLTAPDGIVYTGTLDGSNNQMSIVLESPYYYDGGNLLIEFASVTDGGYSGAYFYGVNATGSSIAGYSGSGLDGIVPFNCNFIPKTTFTYTAGVVSCHPVGLPTVSGLTSTCAVITWNTPVDGGNYIVQYKTADQSWGSPDVVTDYTTDTTYDFAGSLNPVTTYHARIANLCGGADTSSWRNITFTTSCGVIVAPFFEDFNAGTTMPDCWQRFTGLAFVDSTISETTSGWNFNNNYAFGQYHARLNIYGTGSKYWLVTPQIDLSSLSSPALEFDMALTRYNTSNPIDNDTTEQMDDKFMVIVSTDNGATWSASDATVWDNTGSGDYVYNRISSICEHVTIDLAQYAGQSVRIAFYGESTVAGGDNDLHIDNVRVDELPACVAPTQVVVTNVTGTSADIAWTENGTSTSWTVEYGPAGFEEGDGTQENVIGTPSFSITGLNPATQYEVRISSDCVSDTVCKLFFTGCMPISTVPYSWDFEDNLFAGTSAYPLPTCWSRIVPSNAGSTLYPYVSSASSYAHSGTHTLYFSNYYGTQYAIMPELDVTALDFSNLMVTFFARNSASGTTVEVGVMSDPTDTATFTVLQSVDPATSASVDPYVVSLNGAVGLGNYIAFRNITAGGSYTYTYVDDVTLMDLAGCMAPMQLTTVPATFSATLSWTGNANAYNLYYKADSDSEYVAIIGVVLDEYGNYELTGLTPNTSYRWYVAIVCEDGSEEVSPAVLFTTECAPEVAPFLEDFNGGAVMPDCWATYTGFADSVFNGASMTASAGYWSFSNTQVFGANHPKINIYGTGVHNWLVSPAIDLTGLNTPALTFDLALTKYNTANPIENDSTAQMDDKFIVVISTDNGVTWSAANATVWDNTADGDHSYNQISSSGDEIAIPLTQYANQTIRIAFYGESTTAGGDNDLHIDNVRVNEQSVCATPTQFVVSNVTATSADLSWQANDATNWVVEYDTAGFTLGEGLQINVSNNPSAVLNGLEPSTDYDVYVYAVCIDGSTTNTAFKTFRTDCVALTDVPQMWNFDANLSRGTSSYPLPDCWRRITSSSSSTLYPYAYSSSSTAHSGDRSLYFYNYYPQSIAVLPSIDNTVLDITSLQVSFFARISSANNNVAFEVGVMTDPMDASTFTPVQTLTLTESYPTMAYEVPFMNYTGAGQYIAFRNTASATVYSSIYVDDVTLEAIPACSRPQNLTTVTTTETSATLSWESTASTFTLYYKPTTDSVWQSESNVTLSGGTYTLDNLTVATIYDWYVETACSIDTELVSDTRQFSTKMLPVTLPYSTDFTTDQNWMLRNSTATNYWVMGVPTGDTEGALFITDNGTDAQYNVTSTAVVIAEKLFTMPNDDSVHVAFDVKVGGEGTGTPYDYLKVFFAPSDVEYEASNTATTEQSSYSYSEYALDFSNYLSQTGETTYVYKLSLTQDSVLHIDMMLPKPDASGLAKFVFMWRNDHSSGTQPGAVIRNFTINTGSGPVVTDPTVATNAAENIVQTTATLKATITNPDGVTITAKGFQWKATTGGTYTSVTGTGTGNTFTANLTNLTPNTSYTYKAFITFNGTTVEGSEMTFTTLPEDVEPCETPTNLHASTCDAHSITIGWNANGNATSWNIRYRVENGSWSSATSTTNSYVISGLVAETVYEIQVQANCGNGNLSDWCEPIHISTTIDGIANWLESSVSLYPNPAREVVNVQCTMNNVQLTGELSVFDVYGKLLQIVPITSEITPINVSGLANGMYFVRVTTEEGSVTKTFVKR